MNIGKLSEATGVTAKMIRHYEEIGLIPKAMRTQAGYRVYDQASVQYLSFIKKSRNLGFSTEEIRQLLSLWRNKKRSSREVKQLVEKHLKELDQKIAELQSVAGALRSLSSCCHGDQRQDCPILDELEKVK